MKKIYFVIALLASINVHAQNVGIGTATPNPSSVLDISSPNKGVLIPRVLDTATINNPMEGLIIYNKNTKSPYYYNGSQWLSLGGRLPNNMATSTDRITYVVTGTGFSAVEREIYASSNGVSTPVSVGPGGITSGAASFSSFIFSKPLDVNSKALNQAAIVGTKYSSIEFKFYATGAVVPYISYKLRNAVIESYQVGGSMGGEVTESISIAFEIYGFKDWVNSTEFGYNLVTKAITTY